MKMVTNRTAQDVERWQILRDKGWGRMTDSERSEWLGEVVPTPAATRGMYTHNDMNRVEAAVEAVASRMRVAGRTVPDLVTKTDWTYTDAVRREDIERYYSNIAVLRGIIPVFGTTPVAPSIERKLDYEMANEIEQILVDLESLTEGILSAWFYSGELVSGEV